MAKWFGYYRRGQREQVNESGANMATSKSEQTSGKAAFSGRGCSGSNALTSTATTEEETEEA